MSRHISTVRSYECILYYNKNIVETAKDSDLQAFGPGWRVEFRPLELQLTDFENAAYYGLLSSNIGGDNENDSDSDKIRTKLFDLYMPLSYVEENLRFFSTKFVSGYFVVAASVDVFIADNVEMLFTAWAFCKALTTRP